MLLNLNLWWLVYKNIMQDETEFIYLKVPNYSEVIYFINLINLFIFLMYMG